MTRNEWIVVIAAIALLTGFIFLGRTQRGVHEDRVGEVKVWNNGADFAFAENNQAEVLAAGLGDVRGLACGGEDVVFLTETNGRVLWRGYPGQGCRTCHGGLTEVRPMAPDNPQSIDQRGAAFLDGGLLLAQHGNGSIGRLSPLGGVPPQPVFLDAAIHGPSGIAVTPDDYIFVTDDRPWPKGGDETALETTDYRLWLDKGTPRMFGAVLMGTPGAGGYQWESIATRLRHPSGIAAAGKDGPIYVAENDSSEVRWVILEKDDGKWAQNRALGAAPAAGGNVAPFLGMAISTDGRFVFAAGPAAIYVFRPTTGEMLGQIRFDEPVGAMASCVQSVGSSRNVHRGRNLYFMLGHRLCRIWLKPSA